jgi:recombination protein RecT
MSGQVIVQQPGEAQVRVTAFETELDAYTRNFAEALPSYVPVDKFKRVLITAVGTNPDLLYANRRTFITAAVKCASDGLLPDGREAALVVFNTEVKLRNPRTGLDVKTRIDAVQYMPMVAGLRKRMRNTGELLSADAEVVYRNDEFDYSLGDEPFIKHKPAALGEERGEMIGAYAIIKLKNGEVLRDVMSKKEIETTRQQGRAPNSLMWKTFPWEGYKKTVLRRCSKAAPQSAELEALLGRDDELEPEALAAPGELVALPPLIDDADIPDASEPAFIVVALEGEVFPFQTADTAADAIRRVYAEAAKYDLARLVGVHESNAPTLDALVRSGHEQLAVDLAAEFDRLRAELKALAERAGTAQATTATAPSHTPPDLIPPTASPPALAAAANEGRPFPGDMPGARLGLSVVAPPAADGAYVIPPVVRNGKPDWRVWTVAMFLPKLRQKRETNELALFMGDNDENLKAARAALAPADLAELNAAIDHQWQEIPP